MPDITHLIGHPELLSRDTLYTLRSLVARHPTFQTARLLMLQNLYLLREPDFGTELKRSVFYIADRRALWQIINGLPAIGAGLEKTDAEGEADAAEKETPPADRTLSLIDSFLRTLPEQPRELVLETPVSVDYMAVMQAEAAGDGSRTPRRPDDTLRPAENIARGTAPSPSAHPRPESRPAQAAGDLAQAGAKAASTEDDEGSSEAAVDPGFFTETLARIYIKQKKYDRALEIIRSLYLNFPEKNIYFADQIRFLEKILKNNNSKKID